MEKDKQNKDSVVLVRLTPQIHKEFSDYCDNNGYSMSKRIRLFIEKDLSGKIKFEK